MLRFANRLRFVFVSISFNSRHSRLIRVIRFN